MSEYLTLPLYNLFLKADEAARDSRQQKQDRYAEMRRRKDEEREAQERLLVGCLFKPWIILTMEVLWIVPTF